MSEGRRQQVGVWRVPCRGPGDLSGVQALVNSGELVPSEIVAVMGKTEGNGCVNDFTREYAADAWCHFLAPALGCTPHEVHGRVALVMSGGTEGVLSPHFTVFARHWVDTAPGNEKRLVIGVAQTREFLPEELGRRTQIRATAEATRSAMRDAGITDPADVHFLQVKCPLLTSDKVAQAISRDVSAVTHDSYESMGYSRGASALGVALGLGELHPAQVTDEAVLGDWTLYSSRHARAAVGAVLASVSGHGGLYVSGGAEHQGPPGGGPVAAIVRMPGS